MQRFFDIALSLLAILILLPLCMVVALILCFTGEGYIFYFQKRVGQRGEDFNLIKFATMLKNSPQLGAGDITIKDDPRVLPFGRFLRKTKINELPQLVNVLIGDMSFVGPRPLTRKNYNLYSESTQKILNTLRPGLTGVGSIFFRDEERFLDGQERPLEFYEKVIAPYKGDIECWYKINKSLRLYFCLILLTIFSLFLDGRKYLLKFKGIPQPDSLLLL